MSGFAVRREAVRKDELSPEHRLFLDRKDAELDHYDARIGDLTQDTSSIPDYLDTVLLTLESEIQYILCYKDGLKDLYDNSKLSPNDYRVERDKIVASEISIRHRALAIRLERRILTQDMEERMPVEDELRWAYSRSWDMRERAAIGNQRRLGTLRGLFEEEVLHIYQAKEEELSDSDMYGEGVGDQTRIRCHVLGWPPEGSSGIVHIVPEYLDEEFLAHIFGAKIKPATDLQNTLVLHHAIGSKLLSGDLVIMPAGEVDDEYFWECIITNESLKNEQTTDGYLWSDIHKTKLNFRVPYKPARRYVYFRFFMSYLKQKWIGNTSFTKAVEEGTIAWPEPGAYLRKSFVRVVTTQFFGEDLSRFFDGTFSDDEEWRNSNEAQYRNERAAVWLMQTVNTLGLEPSKEGAEADYMENLTAFFPAW